MKLDPTTLVLFLLATTGGAYVWAESVIGRPARIWFATRVPDPWSSLAYCARCAAFWVALALLVALLAGAPVWALLPLAGVGLVRIVITPENALDGDAEWLRKRSGSDGRGTDAAAGATADGTEDRDEPAAAQAEGEEGAVRDADEASAHGDGGAQADPAEAFRARSRAIRAGSYDDCVCPDNGCAYGACITTARTRVATEGV